MYMYVYSVHVTNGLRTKEAGLEVVKEGTYLVGRQVCGAELSPGYVTLI